MRSAIRSRFWKGTAIYAGTVLALLVAAFCTESTIGPALYLTAGAVTLPMGVLIYPSLWISVFITGAVAQVLRLGDGAADMLGLAGVAGVFVLAAVLNAVIIRELWRLRPAAWRST